MENNIPKKYRPIPFWSWNEKLDTEETARQINLMNEAGIGGYFMHARGGLETPYMSQEWFDNIQTGIEEGTRLGMEPWAYDEAGWPSGFGAGKVCEKGLKYQQKTLRMGDKPEDESRIITRQGDLYFYYDVNPYYVDVLDAEVIADFINEVYEPYYQKFGNTFRGFFTDEPQFSFSGVGWSFTLPDAYKEKYGEDLIEHLPELFLFQGDYQKTRMQYWRLVAELFSKNFSKQLYDWCDAHGLQLTGHMLLEESFNEQISPCGAVMPNYEYYHIPAMDCLGREIIWDLTPHQVGSAAQQMGKKQVLSETFAACGHNVSFDELMRVYGHQMIHGVNLLCQHLEGYSMRGLRKRDWPPAMYYQQPWWDKYERFNTCVSRIGQILAEGKVEVDTLLMHPQTTAWILFDGTHNGSLKRYYQRFKKIINQFDAMHVPFHLGDEIMIERHGRVEGNKFIIGEMAYSTVVIPEHICFFPYTEKLLEEFKANGGKVVTPDAITERTDVIDNPQVLYTKRIFEDKTVYYFQNCAKEAQTAKIGVGSYILDTYTGEKRPLADSYTFAACEALLVVDDGTVRTGNAKEAQKVLPLAGEWKITEKTPNVLTLDSCDYYFDGEIQEKNGYVLNIMHRALQLERPVEVRLEYHIDVETAPEGETFLVCETPNAYHNIAVNGKPVPREDHGFFRDHSFRKLDISGLLEEGENTLTLEMTFTNTPEGYEKVKHAYLASAERNKLSYELEIEPCYIIGDFGVDLEGQIKELDRNAFQFTGKFPITEAPETLTLLEMEKQGYPFFAGIMTVTKEFDLEDTDYCIRLIRNSLNAVSVNVNGNELGTIMFRGDVIDCAQYLKKGKNRISLTLLGTLRNMMGPHHLAEEHYRVKPSLFYKEKNPWPAPYEWVEPYCFVEVSLQEDK